MPSPTSDLGSGKISSTCSVARIGPPAAMRPTSGTLVAWGMCVADAGLVERALDGAAHRATGGHDVGQEDLEGARPVGIALDVAERLEGAELVRDGRRAGEADRRTDLAHARRIAALLDLVAQELEHLALPRGQPGGVRGPVGKLGDIGIAIVGHAGSVTRNTGPVQTYVRWRVARRDVYVGAVPKPLVKPGKPRSAVVTGAGRGIGRAIAVELVGRGYEVIVTDLDADAAEITAKEIGAALGLGLDVTDPEANRDIAARARELAPLGAWVCNAGVLAEGDLTALSVGQVRAMVEVNVLGVMWGVRAAADAFRDQHERQGRRHRHHRLAQRPRAGAGPECLRRDQGGGAVADDLAGLGAAAATRSGCTPCAPTASTPRWSRRWTRRATYALRWPPVCCSRRRRSRASSSTCSARAASTRRLPAWRGAVARTASLAPRAAVHVDPWVRRLGARRLKKAGKR